MARARMTALTLLPLAALLAASCFGGGGGPDAPTPVVDLNAEGTPVLVGTPTAGDVDYVRGLCRAVNSYVTGLNAATGSDPAIFNDQARLLKSMAPVLDDFADGLGDAKPPGDLKKFHGALVDRVEEMAKQAKAGKLSSPEQLARFYDKVPNQPAQVQARMEAASAQLPECTAFGVANLFAGES